MGRKIFGTGHRRLPHSIHPAGSGAGMHRLQARSRRIRFHQVQRTEQKVGEQA